MSMYNEHGFGKMEIQSLPLLTRLDGRKARSDWLTSTDCIGRWNTRDQYFF